MLSDGEENVQQHDPLGDDGPLKSSGGERHGEEHKCEVGDDEAMIEIDLEALAETDDDDDEDGESTERQVRHNRAFMTVLHFVLTYPRWSFSLFLLFASWTTPLPTAQEQVTQPLRDLQAVVSSEAKLYHDCVENSFRFQDLQMERVVAAEVERVAEARADDQIIQIAAATDQCFNTSLTMQRSLQEWYNMGLDLFNRTVTANDTTICTANDQERLDGILGADLSVLNNSIQSILEAYITQSLETLRKLLQYSKDRSAYDYDYFIGVKLKAIIGVLDDFAIPAIALTLPEQKLMLELRIILQGLLDALQGAYVRIDLLTLRITEFEASIQGFYVNYIDLYDRFALIGIFVKDFVPDGFVLPDYFDISGVPLASALLPPIFQIPTFDGALPDIDDLISEYIIKAMKLIAWVLEEAAKEATEQTRRIIEEILELLRQLTLLDDYDPPQYPKSEGINTPEDEVAHLEGLAGKTQADTEEAVDHIRGIYDNVPQSDQSQLEGVETPIIGETNQTQFRFLDLSLPEFIIPLWLMTLFGYFASVSFLIECIVQAVRFYRLKRKYEKECVPELPEIDYLEGNEDDEAEKEKEAGNKPSKVAVAKAMLLKNMMNPMVVIGLIFVPFALSILIFWFPHVKATCIDSRRGTFLARHVFKQIQVNKANAQGYALHTASQLQCHRKQRAFCSRHSTESDAAFRNDAAALFALQSRFNDTMEVFDIVDRCVGVEKLDEQFESNCCGLEGYTLDGTNCRVDQERENCPIDKHASPPMAFPRVVDAFLDPACQMDPASFSFEGALFNCSVLGESCKQVPCSGVDADFIEQMTIEADCSAEIYYIQVCLFLVLTVFHAIMINFWNALLFSGVMHLRWRKLKPEGIKLTTHVTATGELVKGGDLQERIERIEKAMKRFELSGWIQIGLSFAVFLVWMITFALLKKLVSKFDMYHA